MNLRKLFRRQQVDNGESSQSIENNDTEQETIGIQQPISGEDAGEHENLIYSHSDQLNVPCQETQNDHSIIPWIVRDAGTFSHEQMMMKQHWPNFNLEVIDDSSSPFHGSTCWSGKLKVGIYEDIEWEILAIYNGIGGGSGDWSGLISVYFISPSSEQIVETLGYTPSCMQKDSDGTQTLNNIRPILTKELGAADTIMYVFTFCETIEKICVGQLPEDTLRTNDYLREHHRITHSLSCKI